MGSMVAKVNDRQTLFIDEHVLDFHVTFSFIF